jgi:hypothetical protein
VIAVTNFLHWRKMTWALLLWSGYIATWATMTGSGPAIIIVWWLVGLVVFRSLWVVTRHPFRQGRLLDGFVWPDGTRWRVANHLRTNRGTEPRRDAG